MVTTLSDVYHLNHIKNAIRHKLIFKRNILLKIFKLN